MKALSILYFLLLILVLLSRLTPVLESLELLAKPLLMPALILILLSQVKQRTGLFWLLVVSLIFSCAGDSFLMFSGANFFIAGLASFLVAHLFYIALFSQAADSKPGPITQNPLKALPFVLYGLCLIFVLWSGLADMKIPVIFYALSILGMALTAYNRKGRVSTLSYQLVFAGALLFLISDSMIAINKFKQPIPLADIWIMVTYGLAQYLIVRGMIDWYSPPPRMSDRSGTSRRVGRLRPG